MLLRSLASASLLTRRGGQTQVIQQATNLGDELLGFRYELPQLVARLP